MVEEGRTSEYQCESTAMESVPNGPISTISNSGVDNEIDLDFLPLVYDIIRSVEREPNHDISQKPRESQDTSAKLVELEKKLIQAREQINLLPGIEHSQEEQLKQLENLRKQLSLKRHLLTKYRNMCSFQIPKS